METCIEGDTDTPMNTREDCHPAEEFTDSPADALTDTLIDTSMERDQLAEALTDARTKVGHQESKRVIRNN